MLAFDFIIEECREHRRVQLNLENLRTQAKLLAQWHREGNYSVGERIRTLARYRNLTDVEALALKFPLSEAQEIIALEAGYPSWVVLKAELSKRPTAAVRASIERATPELKSALPVMFVSNVETSSDYFRDKLGFKVDFLHGNPPFYGSVSRGRARLHLRFVHRLVITPEVRERENDLLSAYLEVDNIKSLFAEYKAAGVHFGQTLKKEPWGPSSFIVLDPDGNCIYFTG